MTILNVTQIGMEDSYNESAKSSYKVRYQIETDSPLHNPSDIAFDYRVPAKGDSYGPDPSYTVTGRSVKKNRAQPKWWTADITFEQNTIEKNDDDTVFDKPDKIHFNPQFTTQVMTMARRGAIKKVDGTIITPDPEDDVLYPVRNSAGQQFQPPPTEEVINTNFKLVRIYRGHDIPFEIHSLVGKTNNADVRVRNAIFPAGTLRMLPYVNDEQTTDEGTDYVIMTVTFSHNPDGWFREIADMGNITKDGKHIRDKSGNPISDPVRLDGLGNQLGSFDSIEPDNQTVIVEWKHNAGSGDYSILGLPV